LHEERTQQSSRFSKSSTAKIDPTFIDLNRTSLQHGKVAGFCLPDIYSSTLNIMWMNWVTPIV
jgi:hypothetical protein